MANSMKCKQCGVENNESFRFCSGCGKEILFDGNNLIYKIFNFVNLKNIRLNSSFIIRVVFIYLSIFPPYLSSLRYIFVFAFLSTFLVYLPIKKSKYRIYQWVLASFLISTSFLYIGLSNFRSNFLSLSNNDFLILQTDYHQYAVNVVNQSFNGNRNVNIDEFISLRNKLVISHDKYVRNFIPFIYKPAVECRLNSYPYLLKFGDAAMNFKNNIGIVRDFLNAEENYRNHTDVFLPSMEAPLGQSCLPYFEAASTMEGWLMALRNSVVPNFLIPKGKM